MRVTKPRSLDVTGSDNRYTWIVVLMITFAVLCIYGRGIRFDFVSFDDGLYVYENSVVKKGLTLEGLVWAFSFHDITYWHPLTWLSHMIDCQIFGLYPGGHHLTGILIHLFNSLLLFSVLRMMTGRSDLSAFAALAFAVHPINVESVAWISERKNVLSTFFWLLTMQMYLRYTLRPCWKTYLPVVVTFLLGLMAKPMLITLPFILLLLDYWPLNRFDSLFVFDHATVSNTGELRPKRPVTTLILEKLPLAVLSIVSVGLSVSSAAHHQIVVSYHVVPMLLRVKNVVVSTVAYMGKLVWPVDLAVFYPYPVSIPVWSLVSALLVIVSISVLTWLYRRTHPFLIVGWLWFILTLLPVAGLIQGGLWPAMADRWAYVPFIGLFIILAWGVDALLYMKAPRWAAAGLASAVLAVMMAVSIGQTAYWQNSTTLFQRAVDVTVDNDVAHNNLGAAHYKEDRRDLAIFHFVEALDILPGSEAAHQNLRVAITEGGRPLLAGAERMNVLFPQNPGLKYLLGNIYLEQGVLKKAAAQYKQALAIRPDFALAINKLGIVYSMAGKYEQALSYFKRKIELQPDAAGAYYLTACVYAKQNRVDLSLNWLQQSIERGFDDWDLMLTDENLQNIRHTEYFRDLVHDKKRD